jgi:hypothetical protein
MKINKSHLTGSLLAVAAASLLISGCATNHPPAAASATASAVKPVGAVPTSNTNSSISATSSTEKVSPLSYGTATGMVKKGVTTQQQLLELFGGPNVMTTDKEGEEVWMYDKTATSVSSNLKLSGAQDRQGEAHALAQFFGIPLVGGIGISDASEKEQSHHNSNAEETRTSSVKNLTFIIKFNPDKTVKEYSVRQASF